MSQSFVSEVEGQPAAAASAGVAEVPYPAPRYAWYCVFILLGIYMNSFLDRQILALLVGFIKKDLALSDSAVGFLMGPAFAIFYTIGGLPLGILADRVSRRWLIGFGQAAWSVASVSFGLGRTYPQLLSARVGVGVGEASLSPAAYSLVADLFPPHRLGTALAVYGMGIYFGTGAAFLGGAYFVQWVYSPDFVSVKESMGPFFADLNNWQLVFFLIAAPTIPLSLLLLTVKEPHRRGGHVQVPLKQFLAYARDNRGTLFCHHFGFALMSFVGYGNVAWTPTFMARIHGWEPAEFGKLFGLVIVIAGTAGIWTGGWLAEYLHRKGHKEAKMRVGMISALACIPTGTLIALVPSGDVAYLLMWPQTFFSAFCWGVAPAAVQELMPNRMRGQASAVYLFVINLMGLALGPFILAVVTDVVFKDEMQIHLSMLSTGLTAGVVAALLLWIGLPKFRKSLEYRDRFNTSHNC